jgi:hypothetical protein
MSGNYKELKYLILWGLIYLIIVYVMCDTLLNKDVIIIATILTALIWVVDMLFLNIQYNNTSSYTIEKMTNNYDNRQNTNNCLNEQNTNSCLNQHETRKYINSYLKKIQNLFKTSDNVIDKWHATFNLPNVNDTTLADILNEQNDDIHDLERHPPSTYENNYDPGSSVFHPQDWYQKSGAFFKPSTDRCQRTPIYIDSTTANLKESNEALLPQNAISIQRIINHVKNRYNGI